MTALCNFVKTWASKFPTVLKNVWLTGGLVLSNLLQFAAVYTEPMNRLFLTMPIPLADFFLIGTVANVRLWAEEIGKLFAWRRARKEEWT